MQDNKEPNKPKFAVWMRKKLVVLFFVVLLAFAGLGARLYLIVRDNSEAYKRQVLSQQQYDSRVLPARRGRITDAGGTVLAMSERVYNVVLDAKQLLEKEEYIEPTLNALAAKFGVDAADVRTYAAAHPESRYYVLQRTIPYEQITAFRDLTDETSENYDKNIQGVWFEESYRRIYPNGDVACDVVGFTTSDGNGLYGLEEYYNDVLSGTPGREYGYLDDDANPEFTVKNPVAGYTVESTIDTHIQAVVERNLKEFNESRENAFRTADGAHNVGCIVMDVNTGEIKAMDSYPKFDLNDTQNIEPLLGRPMVNEYGNPVRDDYYEYTYLTEELLNGMENELKMQQYNALWRNFCINDTYEPGSVAKPFTVATGIENGNITGNEWYECGGFLHVGDFDIYCHQTYGHGSVSVSKGVEVSCNVAMMHIANAIGVDNFIKYQNVFNFGLRTGIDLAGEARTQDLVFKAEDMGNTELATSSFGQGFNVTMIEMIAGFASLINGGYYYEPHTVRRIVSDSGATIKTIEPRVLKQTISQATSEKIREYCNAAVEGADATGKTARPAGYRIGGKTGTAETLPRSQDKWYVVSFLGYAPADNPQIAIYVVVDRPNAADQEYARFATRIVKNVLTEVLPYMGIPMTETMTEAERKELDELRAHSYDVYNEIPEEMVIADETNDEHAADTPLPDAIGTAGGEAQTVGEAQTAGEAQTTGETQTAGEAPAAEATQATEDTED
ncbi:MAG: cell division protein FtsI [Butyrivibrio sp.]|nr:cell division protein FtsI [Butyrivibrio sp.]